MLHIVYLKTHHNSNPFMAKIYLIKFHYRECEFSQ